ncbi:MAG: glycosyltransferase [Erythrobacter sp.]
MKYNTKKLTYFWWLTCRIHLEAFARRPVSYLTAAKWYLLGKRLRAKAKFAPLFAASPCAYTRWQLSQEYCTSASPSQSPLIVALVECNGGSPLVAATLASLASENIPAHCIGPDVANDLRKIADLIEWAGEPWLFPIKAGDILIAGAANAYRETLKTCGQSVIYADDDVIDERGRRTKPHFKPDWNPELFAHLDYLTGSCLIRSDKATLVSAAKVGAGWARAILEKSISKGGGAEHLRRILHSRRSRRNPQLPIPALPIAKILPTVSVLVPTRNRVDLLATCLSGLTGADYPNIEAIIIDNDSDDPDTLAFLAELPAHSCSRRQYRVLHYPGPFNYSAINNRAALEASGELICLLNNDIEMLAPDWLGIMATQALREDVGAVGAQLLYPDGRIQHSGVVIGVGQAAGHAHRFLTPKDEGYFHRHVLPQFVSAVTAACLVVRRDRFLQVGGLDEASFAVAFNDVDLCLKLNELGWQSLYEPRAVLVHHESVSRGFDRDPIGSARFASELAALQRRWKTDRIVDPFHHPDLSKASEQFALAI